MRVIVDALVGIGDLHRAQQVDGAVPRLRSRREAVHGQRFGNVRADAHHRIERGHRLLEHEPDAGAAHAPHLAFGQRQQVAALEQRSVRR